MEGWKFDDVVFDGIRCMSWIVAFAFKKGVVCRSAQQSTTSIKPANAQMDLESLPNELWIQLFSKLEFSDLWLRLRCVSTTFRELALQAVAFKLRSTDYRIRVGWSKGDDDTSNVVDLKFSSFDGKRFFFKPSDSEDSVSFEPPSTIPLSNSLEEVGTRWCRLLGPKYVLDAGGGTKLPISRAWSLLDEDGIPFNDDTTVSDFPWSKDLRCWPPAWLRSYPAAEDYVLDICRVPSNGEAASRIAVRGLVATASFLLPPLLDPERPHNGVLRHKLPIYDDDLLFLVRDKAAKLRAANNLRGSSTDPVQDEVSIRVWLARAGAGLRSDPLLDGLLSRWILFSKAQHALTDLIIRRTGMPIKKAMAMVDAHLLEWLQACRRRTDGTAFDPRINMTWQRRKLHLVHVLSATEPSKRDEIRSAVEAILPD